jgi:hypothetical protein
MLYLSFNLEVEMLKGSVQESASKRGQSHYN